MQISESIEMVIEDEMVSIIMGGGLEIVYITASEIPAVVKFLLEAHLTLLAQDASPQEAQSDSVQGSRL